eukprot:TRINITY_DN30213_c0_g1_i1.p2 TRINITY_DN30213_c0_g1~~TRINITY_DN30213_c0_g1_i1.p2  ORF type:complete len:106 (-),score=27.96 TRINITY_DN30213_c0_g1_i1:7-324(-)
MIKLNLPVARVKRLVKAEGRVQYLTGEAAVAFTRAAELFLQSMAADASVRLNAANRSILHYRDVAAHVANVERLDFLLDIVPEKIRLAPVAAEELPSPIAEPQET